MNQHKVVIETTIDSLTITARQNVESAETTTDNMEEFRQIVGECNSATGVVFNVSTEMVVNIWR